MTRRPVRSRYLAAVAGAALVFGATGWAAPPPPTLTQVGATAIVYRGSQADVVLSYRYAKLHPEGQWLLLDVAMTAAENPIEVPRTAIWLRTPDGRVVPLATQKEFGRDYAQLASVIASANISREPLAYLTPQRPRLIRFFAERGRGLAWPSTWLDQWHNNFGRLFFRIPDGVQKGNYELLIRLAKSEVAIPFTL